MALNLDIVSREDHPRRAVAFLIQEGKANTARTAFYSLKSEAQRWLRTRFDWWAACKPPKKEWFHGWDPSGPSRKYKECFTFKVKEGQLQYRFYGFLFHPRTSDPRYEVCILVNHAIKKQWKTEKSCLEQVISMRADSKILEFIIYYFGRHS